MNDVPIVFDHVWKRFRRGAEDSMRDAIPALVRRIRHPRKEDELREREFWAVKDVSFEVERGEALGIIGPNGAGKSTILKLLSRILRPNKGAALVDGRISALIEVAAGFHPDLTGRENVYLNGSILGMRKREIDRKYDRIVDFAGVADFMDTPVKRYSSGMYARLGFAVAAHMDPDVLLVDEVLSVGDLSFQSKCVARMHEVRDQGTTIVFVSHNLKSVATLCHRALLLGGGQTQFLGPVGEAIAAYTESAGVSRMAADQIGEAQIAGVVLRDATGNPTRSFAPGDPCALEVEILAHQDVRHLAVGLFARNERGELVLDTTSVRLGHEPMALDAGGRVRVVFHLRLNLAGGVYRFGCHLTWPGRTTYSDYREGVATAAIPTDGRYDGTVYLEPCFRVIEAGGEAPGAGHHPPTQ